MRPVIKPLWLSCFDLILVPAGATLSVRRSLDHLKISENESI